MITYALHGMMGHRSDWDVLDLDLQALDLWRVGGSSEFENWSQTFNDSFTMTKSKMLIGYSMGARLALHALLSQPNAWKGIVVISAHPGLKDDEERQSRLESDRLWAARARDLPWQDFLVQWNEQSVLKSGVGSKSQAALENVRESVARAFECWSLGNQTDLRRDLSECATPVLWITGGQDEKFKRLAAGVVASNDCFEHAVIPDAGHRILFENGAPLKMLKTLIGDFQKRIL